MSNLYQHWYGLCHRCPIQGAISGISKQLTNLVPLEAPHHRGSEPWERGHYPVSVFQSQRMSSLAGDSRHEHAPSLPHHLHISALSNVGNASSTHILSGTE
ncbi:hypothetical protein NPIL_703531 [Nephila pilipes]|uniref:Uncharacterized protein n=1 Tax=Nephila pilipes TaxID=299642 RepID=A0A8X6MUY1_NEPPI|nr:hypothetical protein NPIL_703531 [Nephila pilipes]